MSGSTRRQSRGPALAGRTVPLQGNYSAAKHAIKAMTDTMRMELERDGIPISVTLIKPASIDTPLFEKARSYLNVEPQPIPPVYAPEVVARAILEAAQRPVRDVIAGGGAAGLPLGKNLVPRLMDKYMENRMFSQQQTEQPLRDRPNNLHEHVPDDGGERGPNWKGRIKSTSLYTRASLHPRWAIAAAGAAVGMGLLLAGRSRFRSHDGEKDVAPLATDSDRADDTQDAREEPARQAEAAVVS